MSTRVTRSTFTLIVLKSSYHHYFRISNAYHLSPLPLPRTDNCSKVREFPKHPKGEDLSGRICARDSLSQKGEIYLVEEEGGGGGGTRYRVGYTLLPAMYRLEKRRKLGQNLGR